MSLKVPEAKIAKPDVAIHDLISGRYSPYGFSDRLVSDEDLRALFEAARWAPSSYNEQPWFFIIAKRSDKMAFEKAVSCLVEGNQPWARHASVLGFTVVARQFTRNGKPNRAAEHDVGLASATLTVEATARGIAVHQMIGIEPDKVRGAYNIPAGFDPLTGITIGYAEPESNKLPEAYRDRDKGPRARKSVRDFVFTDGWGQAAAF